MKNIIIQFTYLMISFCILNNAFAAAKFHVNTIISGKATFMAIDGAGISNISHNGNIVVGDISVLPMIYRLFIPYDKQVRYAKCRPFTYSFNDQKFEFWNQLATDVIVSAVSDNKVMVGTGNVPFYAFYWTKELGIVKLPYSLPGDVNMRQSLVNAGCPASDTAEASDISADGKVIAGTCNNEAFLWTEKMGMIGLGCLSGAKYCESRAYAISADGKTVVGDGTSSYEGWEAFKWTKSEGMTGFGTFYPPKENICASRATGVSGDGSIIVGILDTNSQPHKWKGFYWTKAAGLVELGDIVPKGVSDDGRTIVGVGASDKKNCKTPVECGLPKAFIWTPEKGIQNFKNILINDYNLPIQKWSLTDARAISGDSSVIVGNGLNPDGYDIGWIVKFKKNNSSQQDSNPPVN